MITSQQWLDPTRAIGLLAYAGATICCGMRWIRAGTNRQIARLAAVLMLIEGALLMDIVFNWRWQIHQLLMTSAMQSHEYGQRRFPQVVTITLLGGLLLAGILIAWRFLRDRGTTFLAVSGTALSVILWCVEVVSLHAVDHILYSSLSGVMAVSLLWVLACLMTSIGILLDPQ